MRPIKVKKAEKVAKRSHAPQPTAAQTLAWYDHNRRIMPWRALTGHKPNPYHVWLSEVMLQQTTVASVVPYFQKFIRLWPTVQHLAQASLDDILTQWSGLGYYRRARSLHQCAQQVVTEYGGVFPPDEISLLALPGLGPYAAAAISAIAFDQRANVVDGNVERVMARLYAVQDPLPAAKKKLRALALGLLPDQRFGDYAQALMDLGAVICTPRNPKCDVCPFNKSCQARRLNIAEKLPKKIKPNARPVRHTIAFLLTNQKGEVLLRRRPDSGLFGGMMEIPSSTWREGDAPKLHDIVDQAPIKAAWKLNPQSVTHVFSHFELQARIAVAQTSRNFKGEWVAPEDLGQKALPTLMHKIAKLGLKKL